MKKLRIATVGTNFIVDLFCDAVRSIEDIDICAAYSRKSNTGETFSKKHGIRHFYTEYDRMLADEEIDAVYIASPTFLHCEHSVAALSAGKHVLCEKSISITPDEFYKMRSASERNGKVLLEAMRPAHTPIFKALCDSLHLVGNIESAMFSFKKYSSRYDNFKRGIIENAFNPDLKNSALSDIGVYPVWMAVALFGEPDEVDAYSYRLSNGFDGEGWANLGYRNHSVKIQYSKITESSEPSFIKGEMGTLFIDKISEPHEVYFVDKNNVKIAIATDPCKNNMVYELEAFYKMTRGDISHLSYLDDSERLTRTMQRIADSQLM